MNNSDFTPNGVKADYKQGNFTYFKVEFNTTNKSNRAALNFTNGKGWNKAEITKEEFESLKGELVYPDNLIKNNGFFNLKK